MALREILVRFGMDVDSSALGKADSGIGGLVGSLRTLGLALSAGVAINGLKNFVLEITHAGDELNDSATRLGISAKALQQWRFAAGQSGIEAQELGQGLQFLQRNMFAASQGSGDAAKAFRRLGVRVKDSSGRIRSTEELLPQIADGFAGISDPATRTATAMQIFGRSGARLLPLLNGGAAGVERLRQEFEDLGGGLSDETIAAAAELDDEFKRLDLATTSLKSKIGLFLLPIATKLATTITKLAVSFQKVAKNSNLIKAGLIVLGVVAAALAVKLTIAFAGPILTVLAFAAVIGVAILVVDDLITLFEGGQSVIGEFIDAMFGAGTATHMVIDLRDAWAGLLLVIEDTAKALDELFGGGAPDLSNPADVRQLLEERNRRRNAPLSVRDPQMAAIQERQARAAASRGVSVRFPGETPEQAQARLVRLQGEQRASARTASVPRRGGRNVNVNAPANVQINVAPGTDRRQLEGIRRGVRQELDAQSRATVAALAQEAIE